MKKAKILSALMALSIVSTQTMGVISDITFKSKNVQLTAYAYTENVPGQWIQDEKTRKWWYEHDDGSYTKYNWEKIDNEWYFFDESGWMQTGWLTHQKKDYYLDPISGVMQTGWKKIKNTWYYFDKEGVLYKKGWLKDDKGDYYYLSLESGAMRTGWLKDDKGDYYYLSPESGAMRTGWVQDKGNWYYLNKIEKDNHRTDENKEIGALLTGFYTINGNKYYFNKNDDDKGKMMKYWQEIDGKWYYFNPDGIMLRDWQIINNKKYYLGTDGVMYVGLQKVKSDYYYFNEAKADEGNMLTGWQNIKGGRYYFNENGIMNTGWFDDTNGKKYYLGANGVMRTGFQDIDNKRYYFNEAKADEGNMLTGWQVINGNEYYFNSYGVMQTKDQVIDGKKCYFDTDGVRLYPTEFNGPLLYTITEQSGINIYPERNADCKALSSAPMNRDCYIKMIVGNWGYVTKIRGNDNKYYEGWVYIKNLKRGWPCKIIEEQGLRLRQNAGSTSDSNTVLGCIPKDEIVVVTDSYKGNGSIWVKVEYNGVIGWICFLNGNTTYCVGVSDYGMCF